MIFGQAVESDRHSSQINRFLYSCFICCGDSDRDQVYDYLVVPLRNENITTGFNFEECLINKSGKSIFDIQCDMLKQCEHLIFYISSSYLEEKSSFNTELENVLYCVRMGFISSNRVLIIIANCCELPEKLRYNLPEAAINIHNWSTGTWTSERMSLISQWIKKKKTKTSEMVVSTLFLG